MDIRPVVRQLIVAFSILSAALSAGGANTYPGVLIQQLRTNDSTINLDFDTATWIGSVHGLSGIPSILMPIVMQWRGRKLAFISASVITLTGWISIFAAKTTAAILIGEMFHGLGTNSLLVVCMLSLSEMMSPKYRNIVMHMFGTILALGMASVGAMVRYVHWKTISLIFCIPVTVATLTAFLWPESPSWLACKAEFDKCEKAFISLRGSDDEAMIELKELIEAQKENLVSARTNNKSVVKQLWDKITRRDFYLPALHMFLLMNMMYWSGNTVVLIYSIDMIRKATQNEDAAYFGGIAINVIFFLGTIASTVLVRFYKNKTVLLCSTFGAAVSLFGVFFVTLLQRFDILAKDSFLCLYVLIAYMVTNCLSLNSTVFVIAAELMPVRHRNVGGAFYVIFNCTLLASSMKTSPYLLESIDMWGTFLIYTVNAAVCGLLVWKHVPETKGRTLQEIEDYYAYGNFYVSRNSDDDKLVMISS